MEKKKFLSYGWLLIVAGVIIGLVLASNFDFINHTRASTNDKDSVTEPKTVETAPEKFQTNALQDLSTAFADVAEKVKPSVVTIFTRTVIKMRQRTPDLSPFEEFFGDDFFKRFFQIPDQDLVQQGLGSGVIVRGDGIILTNNHVIKNADDINVRLSDGREFEAKIKGKDPQTDLAVIEIEAKNLPAMTFGDSDALRVGEWVLAVGSPLNPQLASTVTAGIVSAKGRRGVAPTQYEDFIQTDAAINPGNSGGALVNLKGELVGINTAIITRTGGYMGIGFAIPSNLAHKVMSDILEKGRVVRGWLGVLIQDVSANLAKAYDLERPEGAIIIEVQDDSPADKVGLREEDIILELNGKRVKNSSELATRISSTEPGTTIQLKILRDGKRKIVEVELGELPSDKGGEILSEKKSVKDLGFQVQNLTPELRLRYNLSRNEKGVVVTRVKRRSIADRYGLKEGDLILKVNREAVENVREFNRIMDRLEPGDPVAFFIKRGDQKFFVALSVPGT